jgi:hypothetical protein
MASNHGPRRDAAKHRFWRGCVTRWRKSGLSVREFCRREALSEPSFYAWRRELTRRETSEPHVRRESRVQRRRVAKRASFVPVEVVAARLAAPAANIDIILPRGRRLRVRPGFDHGTLEAVLEILERRPC